MYLCIDYGQRYVGLAATDNDGKISYRYGVVDQKQTDAVKHILEILTKEHFSKVLIGVPISLSGSESAQTKITKEFIAKLRKILPIAISIEEVDETLTSVEAARTIKFEGGDKNLEHAEAARIMLDSYLHKY